MIGVPVRLYKTPSAAVCSASYKMCIYLSSGIVFVCDSSGRAMSLRLGFTSDRALRIYSFPCVSTCN